MRVHHIAFRTEHLERLEHFYVAALGLPVIRRESGKIWFDASGCLVMLETKTSEEPAIAEGSNELVAFAVEPDRAAEIRARLARAGVVIESATAYTLYVRDPDGRRIGLSSYPVELGSG